MSVYTSRAAREAVQVIITRYSDFRSRDRPVKCEGINEINRASINRTTIAVIGGNVLIALFYNITSNLTFYE